MDDPLARLLKSIRELKADTCALLHESDGKYAEFENRIIPGGAVKDKHFINADVVSGEPGTIDVNIVARCLPDEWYIEIPRTLLETGVRKIELKTWGWWISEQAFPSRIAADRDAADLNRTWVRVIDHVACRLPGPLAGTDSSRRGEAFIDMRGAYDTDYIIREQQNIPEGILWHTDETGTLSAEEISAARVAGCAIASPNVALWAVGARAAGLDIAAAVYI